MSYFFRVLGPLLLQALSGAQDLPKGSPPQSVEHNSIYSDKTELLKPFPNESWNNFPRSGYDVVEISRGLYSFRYGPQAIRTIFIVTKAGVIVGDPISTEAAAVLRSEIAKITPLRVKYVIYSHDHWDHIKGGRIFKDEGAIFIAQRNCLLSFRRRPSTDVITPDRVYTHRLSIRLGGHKINLFHFGTDHSSCSTYIRLDESPYMFVVDTVIPGRLPLGSMADTDPQGVVDTIRTLEAYSIKGIIPGHGVPLADQSALTERRLYLEALMQAVRVAMQQTNPPLDLATSIKVPQFSYLRGYSTEISKNAERVLNYYYLGW